MSWGTSKGWAEKVPVAGARGEVGSRPDSGAGLALQSLMPHAEAFGFDSKSFGSSLEDLKQRSDTTGLASLKAVLGLPCRERIMGLRQDVRGP